MANSVPHTRLVLVTSAVWLLIGACASSSAETVPPTSPTTSLVGDGLDCPTGERISTIIEPPPEDFPGFSNPQEAIAAISSTLNVPGSPIDLGDDVWEVRTGDRATARVTVRTWGDASWLAAEVMQCGG